MATPYIILKNLMDLNQVRVISFEEQEVPFSFHKEKCMRKRILAHVMPFKSRQSRCPVCGKSCPGYDYQSNSEITWRAPNVNGYEVLLCYRPKRIQCPEHGIRREQIHWSDGNSRFTKDFNNEVAWLVTKMPKTEICTYMMINWRTVGNCVRATQSRLEPDISNRLHDLKKICVDETSYAKGRKYITVVYDMDRCRTIWVGLNQGFAVFEQFCRLLSEEERANITVVAGDGARWIDSCVNQYFPNATRCLDPFHIVGWAEEALDNTRRLAYKKASQYTDKIIESAVQNKNTFENDNINMKKLRYVLLKNPENLSSTQQDMLQIVANSYPELYEAYKLKEWLRNILHVRDGDYGEYELDEWIKAAKSSNARNFIDLSRKIERHKKSILSSIRLCANSAQSESCNAQIKYLIRMARGFRNINNLISLIYLKSSHIIVPLRNRSQLSYEDKMEMRAIKKRKRSAFVAA